MNRFPRLADWLTTAIIFTIPFALSTAMAQSIINHDDSKTTGKTTLLDSITPSERDSALAAAADAGLLNLPTHEDSVQVKRIGVLAAEKQPTEICAVFSEATSKLVESACVKALVNLGGAIAEDCLITSLDRIEDEYERFTILHALGQMQSKASLPLLREVLSSDARKLYWRSIFVFGKAGQISVPLLIESINDADLNVRYNSINLLGQWLIASEATKPLQERFWKEENPALRSMILSSLELIHPNNDSLVAFMKQVVVAKIDEHSTTFAAEAVKLLEDNSGNLAKLEGLKHSPENFDSVYQQIWDAYGQEGDYEQLMAASSIDDEPRLIKLREHILLRDSDEALYDYRQVNGIIYANRLIANQ